MRLLATPIRYGGKKMPSDGGNTKGWLEYLYAQKLLIAGIVIAGTGGIIPFFNTLKQFLLECMRMCGYTEWNRVIKGIKKSTYHTEKVHPFIDREDVLLGT